MVSNMATCSTDIFFLPSSIFRKAVVPHSTYLRCKDEHGIPTTVAVCGRALNQRVCAFVTERHRVILKTCGEIQPAQNNPGKSRASRQGKAPSFYLDHDLSETNRHSLTEVTHTSLRGIPRQPNLTKNIYKNMTNQYAANKRLLNLPAVGHIIHMYLQLGSTYFAFIPELDNGGLHTKNRKFGLQP